MKNVNSVVAVSAHEQTVSAIMQVGANKAEAAKLGKVIADALSALFAECNGDDGNWVAEFGNGENAKSKTFKAGALADDIRAKVKNIKDKEKRESILNTLKSRLSEARALRKAGGMPQPGENLQAALKRYKKTDPAKVEDKAAPAGKAEVMTVEEFAKTASIDQIADLVSLWTAHHGAAAVGLSRALADTLPITVKRNAKQA